jgi:hypothetical protein
MGLDVKTPTAPTGSKRRLAMGYLVSAVFATTYIAVLALGGRLHPALATVPSATLLAVVLVAPLLVPAIVEHLLPRMTAIKIPNVLELALADVSTNRGPSLNAMVDQLAISAQQASATEYANMMTSYSSVIVETVRTLSASGSDVLIVDLRRANAWIPPNLYILAVLIGRRTAVRQTVFVEAREVEEMFVCACEPRELAGALAAAYPILVAAANRAEAADPGGSDTAFARAYFSHLASVYQQSSDAAATKEIWLSAATLIPLLGPFANRTTVEWQETVGAETSRAVLESPSGFMPAVRSGQLMAVLHRDRIALAVARGLLAKAQSG